MTIKSRIFNFYLKSKFYYKLERWVVHILPTIHNQPVLDMGELQPEIFTEHSELNGINMNEEAQLSLLETFKTRYKTEFDTLDNANAPPYFYFDNGRFESVDAEIFYCMIRHLKPRRLIEIGAGFSSKIASIAISRNFVEDQRYHCEYTCIEPSPENWLYDIPQINNIIKDKLENIPLSLFNELKQNDILFIDSSHLINIYNDVCIEYLDILPSLTTGVFIHSHDIILPQRYCRQWHDNRYYFNEQYLLQAFLAFNQSFSVVWAGNFMHLKHGDKLQDTFTSYNKLPGLKREYGHKSFWIKRVR